VCNDRRSLADTPNPELENITSVSLSKTGLATDRMSICQPGGSNNGNERSFTSENAS
jgi:hypothetical protein